MLSETDSNEVNLGLLNWYKYVYTRTDHDRVWNQLRTEVLLKRSNLAWRLLWTTYLVLELLCRQDVQERMAHRFRHASVPLLREIPRRTLPTRSSDAMFTSTDSLQQFRAGSKLLRHALPFKKEPITRHQQKYWPMKTLYFAERPDNKTEKVVTRETCKTR